MDTIDLKVYTGLLRMNRAINGLLAIETRALDELTPAEIQLEANWQAALEPVLADLYWYPLRNGIEEAPEKERELRRWLRERYKQDAAIVALVALLLLYLRRGVNVGGNAALDLIGVGGNFNLTNTDLLGVLDDHTADLTSIGTDLSLIDTTIDHLAAGIPAAKANAESTAMVLGRLITGWAAVRSVRIAATELSRTFANGLNWTYQRNEVRLQRFTTRADDKVCLICLPLDGQIMSVDNIPSSLRVPVHIGCRCGYSPILEDWNQPETIWRGE